MTKHRTALLLASLLMGLGAARAQFRGFTLPLTTTQTPIFQATGPTASAPLKNFGTSIICINYTTTGTVNKLSVQIEGSPDNSHWMAISETATDPVSGGACSNVYLPFTRVNLTVFSGVSPSFTALQAATGSSAGAATGIYVVNGNQKKVLGTNLDASATQTLSYAIPQGGQANGILYLNFSSPPPAGSTISITIGATGTNPAGVLTNIPVASASGTQAITIPPTVGNTGTVTYNPGGGATGTVSATVQQGATTASTSTVQTNQANASGGGRAALQ